MMKIVLVHGQAMTMYSTQNGYTSSEALSDAVQVRRAKSDAALRTSWADKEAFRVLFDLGIETEGRGWR